jgi:hypothetical protein
MFPLEGPVGWRVLIVCVIWVFAVGSIYWLWKCLKK